MLGKNPVTNGTGALALIGAIAHIVWMLTTNHFDGTAIGADWGAIMAGIGLLGAKDAGK